MVKKVNSRRKSNNLRDVDGSNNISDSSPVSSSGGTEETKKEEKNERIVDFLDRFIFPNVSCCGFLFSSTAIAY